MKLFFNKGTKVFHSHYLVFRNSTIFVLMKYGLKLNKKVKRNIYQ